MMSVFNIGFITLSLSQSYVPQGDTYKYCCSTGWSQRYENIPGQKGENSVKLTPQTLKPGSDHKHWTLFSQADTAL